MPLLDPNLIHEFDKRIEHIRRTYNNKQLQALLKTLDQSLILEPVSPLEVVSAPALVETPPPPPPLPSRKPYFYLYVQRHEILSRLNVTKLSENPIFELVCDTGRRDSLSPAVCFNVESEFFMVGDDFIKHDPRPESEFFMVGDDFIEYDPRPEFRGQPFFKFLSVDAAKSPSFITCPPTIAPGLSGPKIDPAVVTLNGKVYVMTLDPYRDQPSFEVFANGKWETLSPPPFLDGHRISLITRHFFCALYAWDHKIVFSRMRAMRGISYCFDTKTGTWTDMQDIYTESEDQPALLCVAEYDKFLIAKPLLSEELLVYELDADGYPHFYQNLDGLEDMFADSRIVECSNAFIIPFDDDADKFCFVGSGPAPWCNWSGSDVFLRVAVFRMTISNLDGKKKLTAVLEAHKIYPFYRLAGSSFFQEICSAFLKRDNLNLDDLKADRSFGRACLN